MTAPKIVHSIRFRLVALSIVIFGSAMTAIALGLYAGIARTQQSAFDTALYNYGVDIAGAIDMNMLGDLIVRRDALIEEGKNFPFPLGQAIVQLRMLNGKLLLSTRIGSRAPLPFDETILREATENGVYLNSVRVGGKEYRLLNTIIERPSIPPLILQVAAPMAFVENERRSVISLLWIIIPLALLAAAVGGLVTSKRALAPVYRIIETARAIRPNHLAERVPVPQETELKDLAITLNDLLARLQKASESQEQFTADASHQLKTPLAIIRGELDVFLQGVRAHARTPEEAEELLGSISQEVNQLSKMVDDLLILARIDSGVLAPSFSTIRLDEAVLDAISQLDKPARGKGVEIELNFTSAAEDDAFEVSGDFDLLKVLFFNLIENAVKYSPSPGHVRVALAREGDLLSVSVQDHGPGISAEEIPRIFDRFYRGSQRQHKIPGVGLGLSIASRIARFHGGDLTVESQTGLGAKFTFRIRKL